MRTDLEYGDIIYRVRGNRIYCYIFVAYVDTLQYEQPDISILAFKFGSYNSFEEFQYKLKYNLNVPLKNSAKVVVTWVNWKKSGINVSNYLMKNKIGHTYNIEYNKDVYLKLDKIKDSYEYNDSERRYVRNWQKQRSRVVVKSLTCPHICVLSGDRLCFTLGFLLEDCKKVSNEVKLKEDTVNSIFLRNKVRVGLFFVPIDKRYKTMKGWTDFLSHYVSLSTKKNFKELVKDERKFNEFLENCKEVLMEYNDFCKEFKGGLPWFVDRENYIEQLDFAKMNRDKYLYWNNGLMSILGV